MSKKEGKKAVKKKTLCFSFCALISPLSNTWNKLVMFALFKQRLL